MLNDTQTQADKFGGKCGGPGGVRTRAAGIIRGLLGRKHLI